ncbi:MAG: DUF2085 domain-containing protein [Oscillochloridaceae bacterium umkhey_bin13]
MSEQPFTTSDPRLAAVPLPDEPRIERPWLWLAVGLFGVLLTALLFWPGAPLEWKMYAVVHGICAQQHNIFLGGTQFPLCARNSGIYLSFLLSLGYFYALGRGRAGGLPPWPISLTLLSFVAIMGLDGFNSLFVDIGYPGLYLPDNRLRTLTGMGMGVTIAVIMHLMLNKSLRRDIDEQQRVLRNWWELLGLLLLNFLVLVAIYANLSFMFWPLAFLAFFGITGVLYLVSLLLAAMVMGYEGKVTDLRQLARPAIIAVVPTAFILGSMATFRFWLEGLGLVL